jgi:predicted AAA+ superfamily ATPase
MLENLVAIQLFKSQQTFYYFNEGKECDFVIKEQIGPKIIQAIQVSRELAVHNREREISGLVQAMEKLQLKE